MIIITTKEATHFFNEGEFAEIRYKKETSVVLMQYSTPPPYASQGEWRCIEDVTDVATVTDTLPTDDRYRLCREALLRLSDVLTGMSDRRFLQKRSRMEMLGIISDCMEKCMKPSTEGKG